MNTYRMEWESGKVIFRDFATEEEHEIFFVWANRQGFGEIVSIKNITEDTKNNI